VWYYHYVDETVTLTTYFPHLASSESEDHAAKYPDLYFDGPDNVTVTQWGTLSRGRRRRLACAQLGPWRPDLRDRADATTGRRRILGIHRSDVLAGRIDPVRQSPESRDHVRHQRSLGRLSRLGRTAREAHSSLGDTHQLRCSKGASHAFHTLGFLRRRGRDVVRGRNVGRSSRYGAGRFVESVSGAAGWRAVPRG